jgi:hypothetical protein
MKPASIMITSVLFVGCSREAKPVPVQTTAPASAPSPSSPQPDVVQPEPVPEPPPNPVETGIPLPIPDEVADTAVKEYRSRLDGSLSRGASKAARYGYSFNEKRERENGVVFSGDPDCPYPKAPFAVGKAGYLLLPRIVQIIGPQTALVSLNDKILIAVGWPTDEKVDGEYLIGKGGAIISDRVSYESTTGAKRTVYLIQPFNIENRLKELESGK